MNTSDGQTERDINKENVHVHMCARERGPAVFAEIAPVSDLCMCERLSFPCSLTRSEFVFIALLFALSPYISCLLFLPPSLRLVEWAYLSNQAISDCYRTYANPTCPPLFLSLSLTRSLSLSIPQVMFELSLMLMGSVPLTHFVTSPRVQTRFCCLTPSRLERKTSIQLQ